MSASDSVYGSSKARPGASWREGQRMAEARLGELLRETVKARGNTSLGYQGRTKTLPLGIDKRASHYAQRLADHPDLIEKVIEEARVVREAISSIYPSKLRGYPLTRARGAS